MAMTDTLHFTESIQHSLWHVLITLVRQVNVLQLRDAVQHDAEASAHTMLEVAELQAGQPAFSLCRIECCDCIVAKVACGLVEV